MPVEAKGAPKPAADRAAAIRAKYDPDGTDPLYDPDLASEPVSWQSTVTSAADAIEAHAKANLKDPRALAPLQERLAELRKHAEAGDARMADSILKGIEQDIAPNAREPKGSPARTFAREQAAKAQQAIRDHEEGGDLEPQAQGGQGAKWQRSGTPRIKPEPITGKRPKNLSDMTLDLEAGLEANIRKGNPGGGAIGVYKPASQDTVVRFSGDVDTTAHEIAHRIDDSHGLVRQWVGNRQRSPFDAELMPDFSQYGSTTKTGPKSKLSYQRSEGVAEWMRAWMVNPDAAKKAAPKFAAHFEATVPKEVRAKLEAFGNDIREWYGANPVDQAIANVRLEAKNPTLAEAIREAVTPEQAGEFKPSLATRVKASLQDDLAPIWKAIGLARELKGIDPAAVLPSKDAQTMTRLWAGVDRKVLEVLNHGPRDAKGKKIPGMGGVDWLFEPIANQPAKAVEADYRALVASMLSERVIDRTKKLQAEADKLTTLEVERAGLAQSGADPVRLAEVAAEMRGIRKKIQFQGHVADVDKFVTARSSRMAGIGANMVSDHTQAQKILAEVAKDPAREARIKEAASRYRKWSEAMLQYSRDKGRLSPEQYAEIVAADDAYVSFSRVASAEEDALSAMYGARAGGKKLGSSKEIAKKFTGSTREIENPYVSLLSNTHRIIKEADRNEALRLITDEFMSKRTSKAAPPIDMAQFARKAATDDPGAIRIFRNGEAESWQFSPPVHEAIKGIGSESPGAAAFLPLKWMASILRTTITNFPPFMIRNSMFRDPMSRAVLSRTGGSPLGHLTYMVSPAQYARDVAELRTHGGALFGNYQPGAKYNHKFVAARMKEMASDGKTILTLPGRLLTAAMEKGGGFSEASETVGRLAEFRTAMNHAKTKLGYDEYNAGIYAASQARGLLDYAVAGSAIRPIAKYVAFLNANIQGLAREVGGFRERPARVAAKWAAYVAVPALATYWWAWQSGNLDEYRQLPAYRRDFFMNFKVGPDTWLAIPKPFSLGVMASGVERTIDRIAGNPDAYKGFLPNPATLEVGSVAKSLVPVDESVLMMGMAPIIEQMTNYDMFRDRNIVPEWEKDLDVSLREGTSRASRVGQIVQQAVGIDARRVDHLAAGMFGSVGKFTTMASDIGRDDKPGQPARLASFLSGIVAAGPGSNAVNYRTALEELRRSGKQGSGVYRDLVSLAKAYGQAQTATERDQITEQIIEVADQVAPLIAELKKDRGAPANASR